MQTKRSLWDAVMAVGIPAMALVNLIAKVHVREHVLLIVMVAVLVDATCLVIHPV